MSEKQSRNEIKGIDPKSYGSFDKVMDKARRVSRYVLPGVTVALTASCTPEMINALAKTVETPDVSPLPSDFTKTPMPSPTEANYELTPTVINPATQELTLVSPTEVATEMPTATKTEVPTPTKEKSLIEGNIFFDPQGKEDFKEVALSPSPIDEPEKFALWHEEYFKQINEKLENYNGPTVEITQALSNGEYGTIEYYSEKWPVAGSYLYKWHGEAVLNKTYIFDKKSDGDGYVLLNTTYYPESIVKVSNVQYNYGTLEAYLGMLYTLTDKLKESWPNAFNTDFYNTYSRTQEQIDSFTRVYFDKPEEGDEAIFSQMQFMVIRTR